ncbi:hypothetical protein RvVAT039_02790 [Agrobacterium vitis]|nr:hypothetical protein RvVAT039_02790 [Agrobacterium vitis]
MAVTAMATYTNPQVYWFSVFWVGLVFALGECAERFDLGRLWLGAAGTAVQSGAVDVVQYHHGLAAGRKPVAYAGIKRFVLAFAPRIRAFPRYGICTSTG